MSDDDTPEPECRVCGWTIYRDRLCRDCYSAWAEDAAEAEEEARRWDRS